MPAASIGVDFVANTARFNADIRAASAAVGTFSSQFDNAAKQVSANSARIGKAANDIGGNAKAGLQQLSYQLGDIATGFASGQKPMQIFAQQSGQVVQALSLMNNSTKGVLGFLAGPWGMIMSAATVALAPLIANMDMFKDAAEENAKAIDKVKLASDGLSDAQSVMGKMFDLATGKLKSQNEMLRVNAQLTAIRLRAEGMAEADAAKRTMGNVGNRSLFDFGASRLNAPALQRLRDLYQSGKITADEAQRRADKMNFSGTGVSKQEFLQAIMDGVSSPLKIGMADAVEKSLKSGQLDPSLRETDRKTRAARAGRQAADPLANADYHFGQTMADLNDRILRAREQLAESSQDEATLAIARIKEEAAKRTSAIEHDKGLTAAQKKIELAAVNVGTNLQLQVAGQQAQQKAASDAFNLQRAANDNQRDLLQAQLQIATTADSRRSIQLRLLDLERQEEENAARKVLATSKDAAQREEAQKRLDALPGIYAARQAGVEASTAGPWESYMRQMKAASASINESMEQIAVNGIQSVNDGLAKAVSNVKIFGGVLDNVAQQAIADLVRLGLQWAETMLMGGGGSALGSLKSLFGGGSDPFSALATSIYMPGHWQGTANAQPGLALVGERGPEIVRFRGGEGVTPNNQLRLAGGGETNIYMQGVMTNDQFWEEIAARDNAAANAGASGGITRLQTMRRRSLAA